MFSVCLTLFTGLTCGYFYIRSIFKIYFNAARSRKKKWWTNVNDMNGCYDLRIRSDLNQGKKLVGTAKKTRIRNTDTQMLLLPALSDKVPSLFSLNGAPPPLHSSYISGSQTQPSRSNTRHRGNIFKRWRAMASRIDITLVKKSQPDKWGLEHILVWWYGTGFFK